MLQIRILIGTILSTSSTFNEPCPKNNILDKCRIKQKNNGCVYKKNNRNYRKKPTNLVWPYLKNEQLSKRICIEYYKKTEWEEDQKERGHKL